MKIKDSNYNAGPKVGRFLISYVLSGGVVYSAGWLLHSSFLGWLLLTWSHLLAPLILPFCWWHYLRLTNQKLSRVNFEQEPSLLTEYLKNILRMPGPRIRLWVRESQEINFFWFQNLSLKPNRSQDLVVTSEWMRHTPDQERISDFNKLWQEIADRPFSLRYLRTLQIIMWASWCSLLSPVMYLLDKVLSNFSVFSNLSAAFFLQSWAWKLKILCFGNDTATSATPTPFQYGVKPRHPKIWNSLTWGVWSQVPARNIHPLWPELMHRATFLGSFDREIYKIGAAVKEK